MELILLLAGIFLVTFLLGRLLEKFRIPWIFAALLLGIGLAGHNPFANITDSFAFTFLAQLGMYFLLFIIGFELNVRTIIKQSKFIIKTTVGIILAESIAGCIVLHYVFGTNWVISIVVASSFSTVGEAVLLPILDEFKLVKTKLGQLILGVGILDDLFEVLTIVVVVVLLGRTVGYPHINIWLDLLVLIGLFGVVFIFVKFHKRMPNFQFKDIPSFFLFVLFFIFLFIGVGDLVESAALGALLSGVALRNIIPRRGYVKIDSEIRTMSYGFSAPLFFLWVGLSTDLVHISNYFHLVILVVLVTIIAKVVTSYFLTKKKIGVKASLILGTSLTVKLSTSIVIIKLLADNGLIDSSLYSVLVLSTTVLSLVVPVFLSSLISKWQAELKAGKKSPT